MPQHPCTSRSRCRSRCSTTRCSKPIEPGTPTAAARLETVRAATEAGFRVTVFLMPILPHLTDSIAAHRRRARPASRRPARAGGLRGPAPAARGEAVVHAVAAAGAPGTRLVVPGALPGRVGRPRRRRIASWLAKRVRPLLRVHGLDGHAEDERSPAGCRGPPGLAARPSRHDLARGAPPAAGRPAVLTGRRHGTTTLDPVRTQLSGSMARFLLTAMPFTGTSRRCARSRRRWSRAATTCASTPGGVPRGGRGNRRHLRALARRRRTSTRTTCRDLSPPLGKKGSAQLLINMEDVFIDDRPAAGRRPRRRVEARALGCDRRRRDLDRRRVLLRERRGCPWATVAVLPLNLPAPQGPPSGIGSRPGRNPLTKAAGCRAPRRGSAVLAAR